MIKKVLGLFLFILGFLIIARFPHIEEYQRPFSKTGIIIGFAISFFGVFLMVS